jgi:hypothetical protein
MLEEIKKSTVIKKRCEYVKECIDKAAKEAREQKLNPIKRFAYVVDKYYQSLYEIYEIDDRWKEGCHTSYDFDGIVDEEVEQFALKYLDPYFQDLINEVRILAQNVVNSKYIGELMNNLDILLEFMKKPIIDNYSTLIKDVEIHEKRKKI